MSTRYSEMIDSFIVIEDDRARQLPMAELNYRWQLVIYAKDRFCRGCCNFK